MGIARGLVVVGLGLLLAGCSGGSSEQDGIAVGLAAAQTACAEIKAADTIPVDPNSADSLNAAADRQRQLVSLTSAAAKADPAWDTLNREQAKVSSEWVTIADLMAKGSMMTTDQRSTVAASAQVIKASSAIIAAECGKATA